MAVSLLYVGDKIASFALSKVAEKVLQYIGDQYHYQTGVKADLEKLKALLEPIEATVRAAENQEIDDLRSPGFSFWLNDLKDAVDDAEDVLDAFDYQLLAHEVEKQEKGNVNLTKFKSPFHLSKRIVKDLTKSLVFLDEHRNELARVVAKLESLHSNMSSFLQVVHAAAPGVLEWRKKSTKSEEPVLYGRDAQLLELEEMILGNTASDYSNHSYIVVSIVGLGGIGKTTLVQHLYKQDKVKKQFHLMAWVCLSQRYAMTSVMVELIESAYKDRPFDMPQDLHKLTNFDVILSHLINCLQGRNFLIVLDDMWDDGDARSKWEALSAAFRSGAKGSKVIVTTRIIAVAELVGSKKWIELEGLDEESFWDFFKKCAFRDVNLEYQHPRLQYIGKQIAKKLGHSPLAAKVVGSLLNSKLQEKHWMHILESKLWKVDNKQDGVMAALKLSFNYLPSHLKHCFGYCSLFPKDYPFQKDKLIHIWMALGYLQTSDEWQRPEDVGEIYFYELATRCFFQKVGKPRDVYVIHDLLHDMAESVYSNEVCQLEGESLQIPRRVRHLLVTSGDLNGVLEHVIEIKRLRSLAILPKYGYINSLSEATFKKLRGLRILMLLGNYTELELPKAIGGMIHLRYLDGANYIQTQSFEKLYHLQTCVFRSSSPFYALPKGLIKLINMRHIGASLQSFDELAGIGQLSSLQELKEFAVKRKKGHQINELKNLNQVRGRLLIKGLDNVNSHEEAIEADLEKKEHLETLGLCWQDKHGPVLEHKEVLEGLRPHQRLKSIQIYHYSSIRYASWLNSSWLFNLEDVQLVSCGFLESFPPLGKLPFLKHMHLQDCPAIKRIGSEFYGSDDTSFPSLEVLILIGAKELMEWETGSLGQQLFPRLVMLVIKECPKLIGRRIHFLSSKEFINKTLLLQNLLTDSISVLAEGFPAEILACLLELTLISITSISTEQEECWKHLISLKKLQFKHCFELERLPATMKYLSCLENLDLHFCSKIQSLPELPRSLKLLKIYACYMLEEDRYKTGGPDWHKISHVQTIDFSKTISEPWPELD